MRAVSLGVVLGFVTLAGCGTAQTGTERIDPTLVTLVPGDSVFLADVRMDALRATPFYKKWIANRPAAPLDDLARQTGLDLRKDLLELLVVSNGQRTAVLARGKFSVNGAEPHLDRPGVTRTPYKGQTLIGNDQGSVTFLNAGVAVAGRPDAVRWIIDQRGRSSGLPPALRDKVSQIPAGNQMWLASAGGFGALQKDLPQTGNLANIGKVISMLESVTAAADMRSGLKLAVNGVCRNEQDAKSLSDAVRGLVGIGRLSTPDNQPELLRAYDGIKVEQQQRSVLVNAAIGPELVDSLFGRFSQMQKPRTAP
jgi:hypothetical protein